MKRYSFAEKELDYFMSDHDDWTRKDGLERLKWNIEDGIYYGSERASIVKFLTKEGVLESKVKEIPQEAKVHNKKDVLELAKQIYEYQIKPRWKERGLNWKSPTFNIRIGKTKLYRVSGRCAYWNGAITMTVGSGAKMESIIEVIIHECVHLIQRGHTKNFAFESMMLGQRKDGYPRIQKMLDKMWERKGK